MTRIFYGLAALFLIGLVSPALAEETVLIRFDETSFVGFSKQRGAHLDVRVAKSSDLEETIKVYIGRFSDQTFNLKEYKITRLNNKRAIIPYLALSPGFKRAYLKTLWPTDKLEGKYLVHRVAYNNETLWTVAQMYTGFGNNYKAIKKASRISGDSLRKGMVLKVPFDMLMDLLKESLRPKQVPEENLAIPEMEIEELAVEEVVPVVSAPGVRETEPEKKPKAEPPAEKPQTTTSKPQQDPPKEAVTTEPVTEPPADPTETNQVPTGKQETKTPAGENKPEDAAAGVREQLAEIDRERRELTYGQDNKGKYAEYRLKKGEAIYSSVVVRFCGLVRASDVNKVAKQIIDRNNIHDVTDMAIGAPIRIPYEFLEAEFKAEDDQEYLNFISNLEVVASVSTRVESRNLEGVTIILDAGHGGRDPGADRRRVWEDDFVYDILCRIKARLEKDSAAQVITTIIDPSVEFKAQDVTMFRRDRDEQLLTTPRFNLSSKDVNTDGVNLRWMLANNRYDQLVKKGAEKDNILFASFHADALHSSIRGTMVYVPDSRHYPREVAPPNKLAHYEEAKGSTFKQTRRSMQQAQARSTQFAANYVKSSKELGVLVHRKKPVRSLIYRNPTRPFVPAVLKFNRVPTRVLIEICNLNNPSDQDLLKRPDFRQQVADAFVMAVFRTYGNNATASVAREEKKIASSE